MAEWYRSSVEGIPNAERLARAQNAISEGWSSEMPADDYRTKDKCITVMREYAATYPSETWTVVRGATGPMVEIPFCLPLGAYLECLECHAATSVARNNPETSTCHICNSDREPIEYGGIMDGVITHSGMNYVLEHKSTSMLGDFYFQQFLLSGQVSGYCWGADNLGLDNIQGCYINVCGVYRKGETKFQRQPAARQAEQIVKWRKDVITKCNAIARARRTGEWDYSPKACTMYAGCEFLPVHSLPQEADQQRVLHSDFVVKPWVFSEEHR
jgi:hypothetical protein